MEKEIKDLKDQIVILTNKVKDLEKSYISEVKKENPYYWIPKLGETYYYHSSTYTKFNIKFRNDTDDIERISLGNCYKTEELCRHAIEAKIYEQSMKIEMCNIWEKEGLPDSKNCMSIMFNCKDNWYQSVPTFYARKFRFSTIESACSFLDKHRENIIKYNIEL
jgi:hypothetical protein